MLKIVSLCDTSLSPLTASVTRLVRTLAEHTTRKHQDVLLAPETVLLSITSTAEQRRPSYWHEMCTNTMTLEKLLNCAELSSDALVESTRSCSASP